MSVACAELTSVRDVLAAFAGDMGVVADCDVVGAVSSMSLL
jgi:hypothetical protein